MCGFFLLYTNQFSNLRHQPGALQFNSDSLTGVGTDPIGEGLSPARLPSLQTSAQVPGCLGLLTNQLLLMAGFYNPLLRFNNLLGQLIEPRKALYLLDHWFIIKDTI